MVIKMIIGKAEFIDDLSKMQKRELDRLLPLKAEESTMLGTSRSIINSMIDHLQFAIAQRKDGD